MFLNLSNHPIATWTVPQHEAALALGLGPPTDLPDGMPQVPPDAGPDAVAALADTLTARAIALGARGAAVFGEPTLTAALVARMALAGIPCFSATTAREATEVATPTSVTKTSTFVFVRWRAYPPLPARA